MYIEVKKWLTWSAIKKIYRDTSSIFDENVKLLESISMYEYI